MQLLNARDIVQPRFTVFIYGSSGSGKTWAAGGFPEPLFLVPKSENSILTLRGQDVLYEMIESSKQVLAIIDELLAIQHKDPNKLPGQTLVMESLSHYADMLIEEISASRKGQMDQQGWGVLASHFRTLHQKLSQLDMNVVYTALAESPNPETQAPGRPLIQGRAREILPSACDVVGFADTRGSRYSIWTTPTRGYSARTRLPLPNEIVMDRPTALFEALAASVIANRLAAVGEPAKT